MYRLGRCLQFHLEAAQDCFPFSVVFIPDLAQGCGVGRGTVAAGIEVAVLAPGIRDASAADLSQDLSAPDLALSCGVALWCSHWERNC